MSGSLSFSYTGAGATSATTFSASGAIPSVPGSGLGTGAWAGGSISPTSDFSIILAAKPKTSTSWDMVQVGVARKTVGTSNIDPNCDMEEDCSGVFLLLSFEPDGDESTYSCGLTTGTITISNISSTNITGTFSGSGTCVSSTGVESAFTVTNGSFNVGVTAQLLE